MTDAEFWRLTPRQFSALSARWREAQRREDYFAAALRATVIGIFAKEPPGVFDLMLDPPDNNAQPAQRQQPVEEQFAILRAMIHKQTGKWIEPKTGPAPSPPLRSAPSRRAGRKSPPQKR